MTAQKCTIPNCTEFAEGDTTPALCPAHLDLDILVEFAVSRKEEPALENIRSHYLIARSSSSFWTLNYDQIADLLPGVLAARGLALQEDEAVAVGQKNSRHAPLAPATKLSSPQSSKE